MNTNRSTLFSTHQILVSEELGGAGLVALNQATYLQGIGHASRAWIPGPGSAWSGACNLGVPCTTFDARGVRSSNRLKALIGNWRISRYYAKKSLVHVHGPGMYGAIRRGLSWSGA